MTHSTCLLSPHRVSRLAAALIWLASGSALQAQAATSADTMQLIKKFTGTRFKVATTEARIGAGMFGLSPEFASTLGKHPEALRAARKMKPYSVAQMVGVLGVAIGAGLALKESIAQADDPLGTESTTTPLAVVAGSAVVALVGIFGGKHYLNQSVRLFNDGQRTGRSDDAASRLGGVRLGVGVAGLERSPRARVGLILPLR